MMPYDLNIVLKHAHIQYQLPSQHHCNVINICLNFLGFWFTLSQFCLGVKILNFWDETFKSCRRGSRILHTGLGFFMTLKRQVITPTQYFYWLAITLFIVSRYIGMEPLNNINIQHVIFMLLIFSQNTKVNLQFIYKCIRYMGSVDKIF